MADERNLEGLDPYDLQDRECARLTAWLSRLEDHDWFEPSGCEGWSRRDLMAHMVAVEAYFAACIGWTVSELIENYVATGATSLDEFNAAGVAQAGSATGRELLETWIVCNQANRAGFRTADGGDIDTSVGGYPCRLQAFHVAFEYAIHGNDLGVPVGPEERDARQDWLAAVARFALTEVKEDVSVESVNGGFSIRRGDVVTTLDRDRFIAGVAGRAGDRIEPAEADLLRST